MYRHLTSTHQPIVKRQASASPKLLVTEPRNQHWTFLDALRHCITSSLYAIYISKCSSYGSSRVVMENCWKCFRILIEWSTRLGWSIPAKFLWRYSRFLGSTVWFIAFCRVLAYLPHMRLYNAKYILWQDDAQIWKQLLF